MMSLSELVVFIFIMTSKHMIRHLSKSDFKAILVNSLKEKLPSKRQLMFIKVIYHNDRMKVRRGRQSFNFTNPLDIKTRQSKI